MNVYNFFYGKPRSGTFNVKPQQSKLYEVGKSSGKDPKIHTKKLLAYTI